MTSVWRSPRARGRAVYVVLSLVAACGSSTSAPPGGAGAESNGGASTGDGGRDVATTSDAADSSSDARSSAEAGDGVNACSALAGAGPVVVDTAATGARPAPTGGTIAPGIYELTERNWYAESGEGPDPDQGLAFQRTLALTATTVESLEAHGARDAGLPPANTLSGTFMVTDSVIVTFAYTCPATMGNTNLEFTANDGELWLFPAQDRREVYRRK